jgi:hypothetical protein
MSKEQALSLSVPDCVQEPLFKRLYQHSLIAERLDLKVWSGIGVSKPQDFQLQENK